MTAEDFVNKKLGEKNYTHSPYSMYRDEIIEWLNDYTKQQVHNVLKEAAEKAENELYDLTDNWANSHIIKASILSLKEKY